MSFPFTPCVSDVTRTSSNRYWPSGTNLVDEHDASSASSDRAMTLAVLVIRLNWRGKIKPFFLSPAICGRAFGWSHARLDKKSAVSGAKRPCTAPAVSRMVAHHIAGTGMYVIAQRCSQWRQRHWLAPCRRDGGANRIAHSSCRAVWVNVAVTGA